MPIGIDHAVSIERPLEVGRPQPLILLQGLPESPLQHMLLEAVRLNGSQGSALQCADAQVEVQHLDINGRHVQAIHCPGPLQLGAQLYNV